MSLGITQETSNNNIAPPRTVYAYCGKRLFDIVAGLFGLIVCVPIFVVIALLVKLSSPGPMLFAQERIGLREIPFQLHKFRTMYVGSEQIGPALTESGDSRITPVGSWLRKLKLDEIPQLWDVLRGHMSLVGPRPEVPRYTAGYTERQRQIFSIRPGITDPASIAFVAEEELLATVPDADDYYRNVLLPRKLDLGLQYVMGMSFRSDVILILRTILAIQRAIGELKPIR